MANSPDEVSDAGVPIPRHSERHRAQIGEHIERHIGRVEQVFDAQDSDPVRIRVHHVAPVNSRPYHTLITSGMSARAMNVPASDADAPRYIELMVTLPEDWKVDPQHRDEQWWWPIRQLETLARFPHTHTTSLNWGHIVPNDDPPKPLAPTTRLCGAIIVPSLLVPTAFYQLDLDDRQVAFFAVLPLYKEELELKLREGTQALLDRLLDHDINDVIAPRRRNVAKRFFGLF